MGWLDFFQPWITGLTFLFNIEIQGLKNWSRIAIPTLARAFQGKTLQNYGLIQRGSLKHFTSSTKSYFIFYEGWVEGGKEVLSTLDK